MSTSKKPRKAYKPKLQVLPLGIRRSDKFEIPGYQASLAMGQPYFCEQHVYDLLANADMVRRIAPDGHPLLPLAQDMVEAVAAIQERAQRTGKHGVTGDEMKVLREGLARTMEYLRSVPNYALAQASMTAIAEFNRYGALRV